jgi:hypothetical protein
LFQLEPGSELLQVKQAAAQEQVLQARFLAAEQQVAQ